jgi:hypothetical protein
MAWLNIPNNDYWQYDDNPPNPGGALTALWSTSTNGVRTTPFGEKIYVNCRHKTLRPNQESVPSEISKSQWDAAADLSFYLQPDGESLYKQPDGSSLYQQPEFIGFVRPNGTSRFLRPDGVSSYLTSA